MKVEFKLFFALGLFMLPIGPIYGWLTHWDEMVGPVGLLLTTSLSFLCAFYFWWTGRKIDDRPEDDPMGEIAVAEGEYGFFSPHSWWPLFLSMSAALVFAGLAVGWWLFVAGAVFGVFALIGWVFEYYHGEYAQ